MTDQTKHAVRLLMLIRELACAPTGGHTAKELARRLGCGPRTIQRDLLLLEEIHIPIRTAGTGYGLTRCPGWLDKALERNQQ